jgi:hypothetical protein
MGGCAAVKGAMETQLVTSLPLYSNVCLINGAVFAAARACRSCRQQPSPIGDRRGTRRSGNRTGGHLATNPTLVHSSLPSVDQLMQRLGKFDTDAPT